MAHRPTDPRSPIQPGGGSGMKPLLLAVVAAGTLWSWQQSRERSDEPAPREAELHSASEATTPTRAKANLPELFSTDDYPEQAIRNEEQGTVAFRLTIDRKGRVSDCTVTQSSGSATLDRASCSIVERRARFVPARDTQGRTVEDSMTSRIRWVLPDE